eukprot:TRINITY_DN9845_c0_g1_i1.p1 TRINITY_DN9845_c0_g1~~TRINITY_DN9845_c0_g1_i1.p1  ORF type:complete len:1608 (-),score=285.57 TRINITY_DN9845_c0_g1_i1:1661-6484(-)
MYTHAPLIVLLTIGVIGIPAQSCVVLALRFVQEGYWLQQSRSAVIIQNGVDCPPTEETRSCNPEDCPPPCIIGEWSDFSTCSTSCGSGQKFRTRSVTGLCEETTQDEIECNTEPCPVDCVMSPWSLFGDCDVTCGDGKRSRSRSVLVPADHGGEECPRSEQQRTCRNAPCPVDCVVGEWGLWSACSSDCDGGLQYRHRYNTQPMFGGQACPDSTEEQVCNVKRCPIVCQLTEWSVWDPCTVTCAGGQRQRTREVLPGMQCDGKELLQTEICNTDPCPIDCEVGEWQWSDCSLDCGGGTQTGFREILVQDANGGQECPGPNQLVDERACNTQCCVVDCVVGPFSAWSDCSATCGEAGTKSRSREVIQSPACEGQACPALVQYRPCNQVCCPEDCEVSDFSPWSDCTLTCGGGTMTRLRTITKVSSCGGAACPALSETKACNEQCCKVDCVVSPYGSFSPCDKTCGGGQRVRSRTIITDPECGGKECPSLDQYRSCASDCCPVDCVVEEWTGWSTCSATCGSGTQSRSRGVITQASCYGVGCPALTEDQPCSTECCPQDCQLGEWSGWTECDRDCGGGVRTRTRQVVLPQCEGAPCPQEGLSGSTQTETQDCNTECCPRDCVATRYSRWSRCDKTCGGGQRIRTRSIYRPAECGGRDCEDLTQTRSCASEACPVDCEMGEWESWAACNPTCGPERIQERRRTIAVEAAYGGAACQNVDEFGAEYEDRVCSASCCPQDCIVNEWGAWTTCSKECGTGQMTRSRTITPAQCQGEECPEDLSLEDVRSCNTQCCVVNCELTDWSEWGGCSLSCDASGTGMGGVQTRSRTVTRPAECGGTCGETVESTQCNTQCCPTDCELSAWTDWTDCTKTCDGGTHTRSRYVITPENAECGGTCDFSLFESETCNTLQCPCRPRNCAWRRWSRWSECSATCGGGVMTQTRTPYRQASCGGRECSAETDTRTKACNTDPCPVTCPCTCQNGGVCEDGSCRCHYLWGGECCESPSQYCSVYGDPHAIMFDGGEQTFGLSNTRFLIDVNYGIYVEGWSDVVFCDDYEMEVSGCVGNLNAVTVLEPTGDKIQVVLKEIDGWMDMAMSYGRGCDLAPLRWGLGCDPEWGCTESAMDTGLGVAITAPEDDHYDGLKLMYHFRGGSNMQIQVFVLTDLSLQVDIYHGGVSDERQGVCWTVHTEMPQDIETQDSIMCLPTPTEALALLPGHNAQEAKPKKSAKWRPLSELEISRGLHGRGDGQLRTHLDYVKCNAPNAGVPCEGGTQVVASAIYAPHDQHVVFRHTHSSPLRVEVDGNTVLEKKRAGRSNPFARFHLTTGWHQLVMSASQADAVHFQWHVDGSNLHFAQEIPEDEKPVIGQRSARSKFSTQEVTVVVNECSGVSSTMAHSCCAPLNGCSPTDYSNCVYDTCAHLAYLERNSLPAACLYTADRITQKVPACRCPSPFMRGDNCDRCLPGWYGDNCQTSCSVDQCNNRGTCNGDGACQCNTGYAGQHCEIETSETTNSACPSDCSSHGTCVDDVCICDAAWNGDDACSSCATNYAGENCEPVCDDPCVEGTCTQPGVCSCNPGYGGLQCDKLVKTCNFVGAGSFKAWGSTQENCFEWHSS